MHSRDSRAIGLTVGGACGIFAGWIFSVVVDWWAWSSLAGLLISLTGAIALIAGAILLIRQRRFVAFVVPAQGDLFGMAQHIDGLPKLIDLDTPPSDVHQ
ncbi:MULTISPECIES: hypothetical protein [unclassified Microbacterium]|uniref:hypothetical protein n=1 Tax=unclassified Microbacterium TaxID=2609290 RepID=UPI0011C3C8AD|nr:MULTISPECIES: hypothetical protein [unclassified Microbacterium]MBT2486444.1 hypothetical protein [Microbacterium sp. ISL-108]